jgi:hypothetical protein
MYTKNQDVAAMHKRHEEFLKYYKAGQSQWE